MLKDLPFFGTTRVANKGVDVTLIVRPSHTAEAVKAARRCGVCGISTAVLEVTQTDPPDQRTLEHFCTLTGRLVLRISSCWKSIPFLLTQRYWSQRTARQRHFPKRCLPSKREKGKAEPESDKTGIIW